MECVLLPRVSLLHAAQPRSIQSTRSNDNANESHSSTKTRPSTTTSIRDTSHNEALDSIMLPDDGDLSVEDTSTSDYSEPGGNARSNGFLDNESVRRKRPRDDENEDFISSESGIFSTRKKAGHPKRRTVPTHCAEESDSDDEDGTLKTPGPSGGDPKRPLMEINRTKHGACEKVRKWLNPKSRVAIIEEGNVITFTFDGRECTHSSGFASDKSSESKSDSFSSADFDDSCAALEAFNMSFYRPLNTVFCKTHRKCIPLGSLKSHISSSALVERHSYTLPRIRKHNAIETFLSHIASAFNLPHDQTFHLQGADVMQLPNPIPYIEEPRLHLQCPQCKMWLCQSDKGGWKSGTLRLHLTHNSKCIQLLQIPESERPALKECYGQRPCGLGGHGYETRVPFVEIIGWSPGSETRLSTKEPERPMESVDPSSQEYAKVLKWCELMPRESAECIRLLCLLPNPSQFNTSTSADSMFPQNRAVILERGLHEVHVFLRQYLEEANDFVDSCDAGLRLTLTEGSVSKCPVVLSYQLTVLFHIEPSRTTT